MATIDTSFLDRFSRGVSEFFAGQPYDSADEFDQAHNEYRELLDEGQSRGLYEIGEGRSRITFEARTADVAPDDCVVKVSKSDGTIQNDEAIAIWEELDEDARECVVTFIDWDSGYRWIVQQQASHSAYGSSDLHDRLHEAGWTCTDIRTENVGELDGQPVLMDLGVGLRPR